VRARKPNCCTPQWGRYWLILGPVCGHNVALFAFPAFYAELRVDRCSESNRMMRCLVFLFGLMLAIAKANAACNLEAHAPWTSAKAEGLTLNAYSVGEVCGYTAVVLTVTNKAGKTLWTLSRNAEHVSIFSSELGMSTKEVQEALETWLKIGNESNDKRTGALPDWPEGAEGPVREGEFGYYAETDMDRSTYLEKRAANVPLFCTVYGIESETCIIATSKDFIQEFGGISFPG
jgi:hypothetical protein